MEVWPFDPVRGGERAPAGQRSLPPNQERMMVPALFSSRARLRNLHAVLGRVAECLDSGISVRLWDGSVVPLGPNADPKLCLAIHGPGVIGSLLRRPTLDNLLTLYASGRLEVHGADLYT